MFKSSDFWVIPGKGINTRLTLWYFNIACFYSLPPVDGFYHKYFNQAKYFQLEHARASVQLLWIYCVTDVTSLILIPRLRPHLVYCLVL